MTDTATMKIKKLFMRLPADAISLNENTIVRSIKTGITSNPISNFVIFIKRLDETLLL